MITELTRDDRERLFRCLVAAMWADGEVAPEEIDLLTDVCLELDLDREEMERVTSLLHTRPRVEELDIGEVPTAHRQMLVDTIRDAVLADGEVSAGELEIVRHIGEALKVPIALPEVDEEDGVE